MTKHEQQNIEKSLPKALRKLIIEALTFYNELQELENKPWLFNK